jgi:EAL domain-containing protein (putative c-di-GMP-specific phosphodiesterase class I)
LNERLIVSGPGIGVDVWAEAIAEVTAQPELIRPHFQPLVDLERGVVAGYEMLARFDHRLGSSPAEWFAAAARFGVVAELDRIIVGLARHSLRRLPPNTFLSVNVTGQGAISERVLQSVRIGPRLEPLVIEITEQADIDPELLGSAAHEFRERGAMLAIDDAGAGYASLQRILSVRPQFIKLDRSLISNIHVDDAKAAATEMMGALASRIDAWIVAEGIERHAELDRLLQLKVPLGQGYLFARPTPRFENLDASWELRPRDLIAEEHGSVTPVIERLQPAMHVAGREEIGWRFADDETLEHLPVVDDMSRVIALVERGAFESGADGRETPMRISPTAALSDVLRRAMTRPRSDRLTPIVCCDEFGRYLGLVRVERLVEAVAAGDPDA